MCVCVCTYMPLSLPLSLSPSLPLSLSLSLSRSLDMSDNHFHTLSHPSSCLFIPTHMSPAHFPPYTSLPIYIAGVFFVFLKLVFLKSFFQAEMILCNNWMDDKTVERRRKQSQPKAWVHLPPPLPRSYPAP